jgi:glycosyltransferase involved in cell wall biosynthesis
LALIVAKMLHKKVILIISGSDEDSVKATSEKLSIPLLPIQHMNFAISDKIMIYSKNIISEYGLQQHNNKTCIAHHHFIDFEKFNLRKPLKERAALVGYIGRLSQEKGILNFLDATSRVEAENGIRFLIGGDGQLRPQVERFIQNSLSDRIKFVGWINHDDLPAYLNELKLLVLPSYTEGLPNIALEAMACGTPVLATPVGSIPDIIKNNENGFIMANNSPECIAKNIIRALNHPQLEQIAQNAYAMVKKEFDFEKAVASFREIFDKF